MVLCGGFWEYFLEVVLEVKIKKKSDKSDSSDESDP